MVIAMVAIALVSAPQVDPCGYAYDSFMAIAKLAVKHQSVKLCVRRHFLLLNLFSRVKEATRIRVFENLVLRRIFGPKKNDVI
jgi:hypothetical protein